jgi:formylglycine-generating enzyme required for sulfatase activity
MLSAVKSFAAELAKGGPNAVGFLYYSGHGVARPEDRANYLIPIDLTDTSSTDFWFDAVKLDDLLGELERAAPFAAHFVVFDACRDELKLPYKSAVKGFEPVAERSGMFIAFATALGAVALDEAKAGGGSGPYSSALAAELVKPAQDHLQLFQNVKEGVFAATERKQVPWERNGLLKRIYFGGEATPAKPITRPAQPDTSEAERAWTLVKGATSPAALEAFIRRFGDTFYGDLAKARLAELKQQADAAQQVTKKKADDAASAKEEAERKRLAMLQLDDERKRAEVEAAKKRAEAAGAMQAGRVFRDCPECPEMVVLPAGEFMMGSPQSEAERNTDEGPRHKVTIAKPFAVGKFEVTFAEWDACVAAGGCKRRPDDAGWGRGRRPVIDVSWHDAKEYTAWLSRKTGRTYRLLSEAEWEYAARAGTTTRYAFGDTISSSQAKYGKVFGSDGGTVEVGSFPANRFGLHDMHGNVEEWVEDNWHPDYKGAPIDGSVWPGGDVSMRVLRGSSFAGDSDSLRSGRRRSESHEDWARMLVFGFRVARTL